MPSGECPACASAKTRKWPGGTYHFTCFACRERFLLDEPCKVMRGVYAKSMERWGEVPNWKVEPNCGCGHACKRRQYITKKPEPKDVYANRKKK